MARQMKRKTDRGGAAWRLVGALVLSGCGEESIPAAPMGGDAGTDVGTDAGEDPGVCGDGRIGPGERCDGEAFGGLTCADFGFSSGRLECAAGCSGVLLGSCEGTIAWTADTAGTVCDDRTKESPNDVRAAMHDFEYRYSVRPDLSVSGRSQLIVGTPGGPRSTFVVEGPPDTWIAGRAFEEIYRAVWGPVELQPSPFSVDGPGRIDLSDDWEPMAVLVQGAPPVDVRLEVTRAEKTVLNLPLRDVAPSVFLPPGQLETRLRARGTFTLAPETLPGGGRALQIQWVRHTMRVRSPFEGSSTVRLWGVDLGQVGASPVELSPEGPRGQSAILVVAGAGGVVTLEFAYEPDQDTELLGGATVSLRRIDLENSMFDHRFQLVSADGGPTWNLELGPSQLEASAALPAGRYLVFGNSTRTDLTWAPIGELAHGDEPSVLSVAVPPLLEVPGQLRFTRLDDELPTLYQLTFECIEGCTGTIQTSARRERDGSEDHLDFVLRAYPGVYRVRSQNGLLHPGVDLSSEAPLTLDAPVVRAQVLPEFDPEARLADALIEISHAFGRHSSPGRSLTALIPPGRVVVQASERRGSSIGPTVVKQLDVLTSTVVRVDFRARVISGQVAGLAEGERLLLEVSNTGDVLQTGADGRFSSQRPLVLGSAVTLTAISPSGNIAAKKLICLEID